jgi:hypothetical protein
MNILELNAGYPRLYSQIFAVGLSAEGKRDLAAELIANSVRSRNGAHPTFFPSGAIKTRYKLDVDDPRSRLYRPKVQEIKNDWSKN